MRVFGDRVDDYGLQCHGGDFRDVIASDLAATLDESKDGLFRRGCFIRAVLGFAAGEGLIGFDELAFATERAEFAFAHGFADAVHHEPCGLVAAAHHAMHLKSAHALLARIDHVNRRAPLAEGDLGTLAHGVHGNGELLAAVVALKQTGAVRFAVQSSDGR
jgi:hypothetical protein